MRRCHLSMTPKMTKKNLSETDNEKGNMNYKATFSDERRPSAIYPVHSHLPANIINK